MATVKANETKMTITAVNKSFNKYTLGPSLSEEVVMTINNPTIPKPMDAQTKIFVVIFCIIILYQLKHSLSNLPCFARDVKTSGIYYDPI